jgi:hypothetical protein
VGGPEVIVMRIWPGDMEGGDRESWERERRLGTA